MPKKYKDIYDQLFKNSKKAGKCIESTYKVKSYRKTPQVTHKNILISVSRASWEYHKGEIPKGMFVCHHCDNPKCFRIEHLFLGTPSDNMQDMIRKRRDNNWGARKYSLMIMDKAKKLREEGYSYGQISKILNIKYAALKAYLIRHKVFKGFPKPRTRKFPITAEFIREIDSLTLKGLSHKQIYQKLGMSEATFYRFLKSS